MKKNVEQHAMSKDQKITASPESENKPCDLGRRHFFRKVGLAALPAGILLAGANNAYAAGEGDDGIVSVKEFGAAGDGVTDDTTAILNAINYVKASSNLPSLWFPAGKYVTDQIILDSVRGVNFFGDTGQDTVVSKTWIYWKSSSTAEHLLRIRSCAYISFENINFFSNANASKSALIMFECNDNTSVYPKNKFASTGVTFKNCSFTVSASNPCSIASVFIKSSILVDFTNCNFTGPNAAKIGKNTDCDPVTSGATVPDGRAVQTMFTKCVFYGDIIRERIIGLSIDNCYFGKNSGAAVVSCLTVAGNEEVRNERISNCACDSVCSDYTDAWYEGPNPPSSLGVAPTLTAYNNFLFGGVVIFNIKAGQAHITGNTFVATLTTGVTSYNAICINSGVKKVTIEDNDFNGLLYLNTGSVKAHGVIDLRSSVEDSKYLLARSRATDFAIPNTGYNSIMAATLDRQEGGWAKFSYHITIISNVDTTFTARFVIGGVAVAGTYARFTTNTSAQKIFVLSLTERIAYIGATDINSSSVVALQVKQETGTPLATVKGESYVLSDTWGKVEIITG